MENGGLCWSFFQIWRDGASFGNPFMRIYVELVRKRLMMKIGLMEI